MKDNDLFWQDMPDNEFSAENHGMPTKEELEMQVSLVMGMAVLDLLRNKTPVNDTTILENIQNSVSYETADDSDVTWTGNFGIEHAIALSMLNKSRH
ncbi:TPA: hypothetical protein QIF36_002414 [Enterobacter kobei]|nr:hypothetical protein [Enterobacter kobei]